MADSTIAGLTAAASALDTYDVPVNAGGLDRRVTIRQFLDLEGDSIQNQSVADQVITAATLTYITGSLLTVPAAKIRAGTVFRWWIAMSKTAAGIAARSVHVRIGTLGTTGDAAALTFTSTSAPTAAADEGVMEVVCTVRAATSTATIQGELELRHNGNTVGFAAIPIHILRVLSGAVDVTVASLKVGLSITTGAAEAITIQQCVAEAKNL